MLKVEKDYLEEYGDIPYSQEKRLDYLLKETKFTKNTPNIIDEMKRIMNIEYEELSIIIWLAPQPTPRPRISGDNKVFYVKGSKNNRKLIEKFIINTPLPIITTPCIFQCESYFPIPKSMKSYEKILAELGFIRPISRPDWDNIGKTYSDMIQSTILHDDSLIVEGISRKYYSSKPRVEIKIRYMKEFDCKYNYKKIITQKGIKT